MPTNEKWIAICEQEIQRLQKEVDELKAGKRRIWLISTDGEWKPTPDAVPNLQRQIDIYTESLEIALNDNS